MYLLGLIVSGLEEGLQTLHVVSGRPQRVRVRGQRLRVDVLHQACQLRLPLAPQVHDGQV